MSTINRVLFGFASLVCTAVTFAVAVSPAIGTMRQEQMRVTYSNAAQSSFYGIAGVLQRPVTAQADTCAHADKAAAKCPRSYATGNKTTFSLID